MSVTATTGEEERASRWLEIQGPCTTPLDATLEYIRLRFDRLLPAYVLAMLPNAVVAIFLIDAIVAGRRSLAATLCAWMVVTIVWRWVWLARLQHGVQRELMETRGNRFWPTVPAILLLRLTSHIAITWGSLLAGVPSFYGLFMGGFAAPLLLEQPGQTSRNMRRCLSWIHFATKRLLRVLLVMTAATGIAIVAVFVSQSFLARTILPSFLNVQSSDLDVTLDSVAWRLRVGYFLFLLIDAYWAVACVFLYYDSQSRRLATDLRVRVANMMKETA